MATYVITSIQKKESVNHERKITVNPVVSKFASWYEKLRNAMEYRDEEVILRATIERILHRRLLLGGNAKTTAEPLVRELVWARYMPDNSVAESMIGKVEEIIDIYLELRFKILQKHRMPEYTINEWIYHLMSSHIEHTLNPNQEKETMSNFMFQVVKEDVLIGDDSEETRDAQVYISVRRSFAKDDVAFLRYHLFLLYFGKLDRLKVDEVADNFLKGYQEIVKQLNYPIQPRIYNYVKNRTAAFLILEDVLRMHSDDMMNLLSDDQAFTQIVYASCETRYRGIGDKVQRAIIRSVVFILLTKVAIAFLVEGTYDRIFLGSIQWGTLAISIVIPPCLMVIVGIFIRPPGLDNSKRILSYIYAILYSEKPELGEKLTIRKTPHRIKPFLNLMFNLLWFSAFILSFGIVFYALNRMHFHFISQLVFIFFLAIVSFLSYRISLLATLYSVGDKQGLVTPLVDFLFMPIVRVGRKITQGWAQINFVLFLFDFFIETPFKGLFAFSEQWFHFLHEKREELG